MKSDPTPSIDWTNVSQRTEEFIRLFTKAEPLIFAYILTLLPHFSDAEDALQQVNLVMWRKFDSFRPGTDFVSWGRAIAHREVLALRKERQRLRLQFSDEFIEAVASDAQQCGDLLEARHRALAACLEKLKARDRDLVERRYQPGATTESVAAQVGRSVDAVYKALNRVREALWQCINRAIAAEGHT